MGPIAGPISAIAGVTAMMASIATAKSTKAAKGGIIPASPGGTLTTIGEGGEAEAIIPLSKFEQVMAGLPIGGAVAASRNNQNIEKLSKEMTAVKEAIQSLRLETSISNKELNVVLTPDLG